jgi:hypothetical protein
VNRFQRRLHLLLWLLVGPACLALLWLALSARPAGPEAFTITERTNAADAEATP